MAFPDLNLPGYPFKVQKGEQRSKIFDPVRKKYVALTPEEWVRQHFVQYLVNELGCPASLIAIEKGLVYNRQNKRSDIVVYQTSGNPVLIVECKAPEVKINQEVFNQVAAYNMTLKVPVLVVTNGLQHFACRIDHENKTYEFLPDIPAWNTL